MNDFYITYLSSTSAAFFADGATIKKYLRGGQWTETRVIGQVSKDGCSTCHNFSCGERSELERIVPRGPGNAARFGRTYIVHTTEHSYPHSDFRSTSCRSITTAGDIGELHQP